MSTKTANRYDVVTNWGYGWECEYSSYDREDAEARYHEYAENSCGRFRVRFEIHREKQEVTA